MCWLQLLSVRGTKKHKRSILISCAFLKHSETFTNSMDEGYSKIQGGVATFFLKKMFFCQSCNQGSSFIHLCMRFIFICSPPWSHTYKPHLSTIHIPGLCRAMRKMIRYNPQFDCQYVNQIKQLMLKSCLKCSCDSLIQILF